jgi:alpha-mannosidase
MKNLLLALTCGMLLSGSAPAAELPPVVYLVPNFHPACCGWLTDFSTERNYCLNSYLDHLDRVASDPNYRFVLSEVPHLIAMHEFEPRRVEELKRRLREGRVELVNAFFLEPTINLSGGEALVKMGVEGLRWQQQVMGVRPRTSWMIDVTGVHEQMAQIVSGLGLEALVYCRLNPTGSTLHWLQSPDGSRTLAVSPGHYLEWRPLFGTKTPLSDKQLQQLVDDLRMRVEPPAADKDRRRPDAVDLRSPPRSTPAGAPVLIFGGSGDYSLAPLYAGYPRAFLEQWKTVAPKTEVRWATFGQYLDAIGPLVRSGKVPIPTLSDGTRFTYNAFWIQNPTVKSWYRRCEHALQAAEAWATAASLRAGGEYPVAPLYHAWLMMLLNMDRNTLWGAAGGMVFEHPASWDVRDRFESVESIARDAFQRSAGRLLGNGRAVGLLNALNWDRQDPVRASLPEGAALEGVVCQSIPGQGEVLCAAKLPSLGGVGLEVRRDKAVAPRTIPLPPVIENAYYAVRIDPRSGALMSLKLKPSGREVFAGPANQIVAETPLKPVGPGDHMLERAQRKRLADSSHYPVQLTVTTGPVATVVDVRSRFLGDGPSRRVMYFYHQSPRIDFETELEDIPDKSVVVAEFPFAAEVTDVRRGIPFGFAHKTGDARQEGIAPAVRWSHYALADGGGVGLFDRGLSGRELVGRTALVYLYNAVQKYRGYPNAWLSGSGGHRFAYALLAHDEPWAAARVPQQAWEFNCPPLVVQGTAAGQIPSLLATSPEVIVEAVRREGDEVEIRLAECRGLPGKAWIEVRLPHDGAALTNLAGQDRQSLPGGPRYEFAVRPQQIITLRLHTASAVPAIEPLRSWQSLVPPAKLERLQKRLDLKGHPPHGY